jgi:hypothetical protein
LTSPVKYQKRVALPFGIPAQTLTIIECHFEPAHPVEEADVVACLFHDEVLPNWKSYEGATRLIDLTSDLDSIFGDFTKGTRYEINRASERDGIEASTPHPPEGTELSEFIDYYDQFALSKGVARIQREQFLALANSGKIAVSNARSADGSVLAAHAYLVTPARARLTHSASLFRSEESSGARAQVGRANRFLHWSDLSAFRTMGLRCYDFGGWYEGSRDAALLNINAFKREFGGRVIKEWNSFQHGSVLGSTYLTLRHLMLVKRRWHP